MGQELKREPAHTLPPGPTSYLDNNPKTAVGLTKPAKSRTPPVALLQMGQAFENGKDKYGKFNCSEKQVSASIYYDAMMRHLFAWLDGEQLAEDSGVHHLAHVMACCGILLDAENIGNLIDDRGHAGGAAELIAALTSQNESGEER